MSSTQVKNQVRDRVEEGFNTLHKIADVVTFPLAPLDGAIHGTARGISNWLLDQHPEDRSRGSNQPQNCQSQPQNYPAQPQNYPPPQNYPAQPQYYPPPPQTYPGRPQNYPEQPKYYPPPQPQNSPGYPSDNLGYQNRQLGTLVSKTCSI